VHAVNNPLYEVPEPLNGDNEASQSRTETQPLSRQRLGPVILGHDAQRKSSLPTETSCRGAVYVVIVF
jgi:hypothetical protein